MTQHDAAADQYLREANRQAALARMELVARREVISAQELMDTLGLSTNALREAVLARRIFELEVDGARYFPAFFADPTIDRRNLERVAMALGGVSGWARWVFFTTPKASIGGCTPLDALKQGRYQEVRRAAVGYAER